MVRRDRQQQPSPEEGYPGESGTPATPITPDTAVAASAQRGHIPETVPDLPSDRIQAEYAPGTDRPDRQPDMPPTSAAVAPPRDEDAPRKMTAEDKARIKAAALDKQYNEVAARREAKQDANLWQKEDYLGWRAADKASHYEPGRAPRSSFTGWVGWLLAIFYVLALGFYGYVRVVHTLGHGGFMIYSIVIGGFEILWASNMLLYCFHMLYYNPDCYPLQQARVNEAMTAVHAAKQGDLTRQPYHVHVIIPCYKDSLTDMKNTLLSALSATMPPGCTRTIFLVDDSQDYEKQRWCEEVEKSDSQIIYISGRLTPEKERSAKAGMLNFCLGKIYPDQAAARAVGFTELICVFKSDQAPKPDFFEKTLPLFDVNDNIGLVLTPTQFSNTPFATDIFNRNNVMGWWYKQPRYDGWNHIDAMRGNVLIRSKALMETNGFPTYSCAESWAIGMELKCAGWQGRYLRDFLTTGEAPHHLKSVFTDHNIRSRGALQVYFSHRNPFFRRALSPPQRLLYVGHAWAFITAAICTPVLMLIPVVTIWGGYFPLVLTWWVALAISVYLLAVHLILYNVRRIVHVEAAYFASLNGSLMWWTYLRNLGEVVLGRVMPKYNAFKISKVPGGEKQDQSKAGIQTRALEAADIADELWAPALMLGLLIISAIGAAAKLGSEGGNQSQPLALCLVWTLFNIIPLALMFCYVAMRKHWTFMWACILGFFASIILVGVAVILLWVQLPARISFATIADDATFSYRALRVGTLPADNDVSWRSNALTDDSGPGGASLTGGWLQGGDAGNLKLTLPTAFTTSMLAWGLMAFPSGYKTEASRAKALAEIRWGTDYLLMCVATGTDGIELVYQSGNWTVDQAFYGRPEDIDISNRPYYSMPMATGAADLASQMVAAFAASSIVWEGVDDGYSTTLLTAAKTLYTSATTSPAVTYSTGAMATCHANGDSVSFASLTPAASSPSPVATTAPATTKAATASPATTAASKVTSRRLLETGTGTDAAAVLPYDYYATTSASTAAPTGVAASSTYTTSDDSFTIESLSATTAAPATTKQATSATTSAPATTTASTASTVTTSTTSAGFTETGNTNLNKYPACGDAVYLYPSSTATDDLLWAASWMYAATTTNSYLTDAVSFYQSFMTNNQDAMGEYNFDWDNLYWGANSLLASIGAGSTFVGEVEHFLSIWACGDDANVMYTADSRAYNLHSSTLPSTANVAFLAALHAANIRAKGQSSQARPYTCWAQSQAQYMLGNHRGGRSYVMGDGINPGTHCANEAASCPDEPATCGLTQYFAASSNPQPLRGCLVSGPSGSSLSDVYQDSRKVSDMAVVLENTAAWQSLAAVEEQVLQRQDTKASTSASDYPTFPHAQTMAAFPEARHDWLQWDDLLSEQEKATKYRVRTFAEQEVAPIIADYWERAAFPDQLVPKLAKLGVAGATLEGYGCPGHSVVEAGMVCIELARVDGSMSTFLMVHNSLLMLTIGLLGSEQQKKELLPDLAALKTVGAWGLTEPSNGSDASALQTTAKRVSGGWELNGLKRWIGNATFADVVVIWARNLETKQINAFIVRKGNPGFRTGKIEKKIALRCVQNADIEMVGCVVPDSARLPGVNSFQDTNKVLAISRILVAWQPLGLAMGVYDMCSRYLQEREQFGVPLASFQLGQERLARMLGNINAMFLMVYRLSRLHEQGKMSHAQASMVKAWTTLRGREVMSLGRELLGGNGIVSDFLVAKAFCDAEAYYTYEGTYDVNVLVTGREATGIAAIKAPARRKQPKSAEVQA